MYSYEDRIKAIALYIKYNLSVANTVRELGYPDRKMLVRWYKEYIKTGKLHKIFNKKRKYTELQMKVAVNYYLEHGQSINCTIRAIGYPSRATLKTWIEEMAPLKRKSHLKRSGMVEYSQVQKRDAVIELCAREGSSAAIATRLGVSRYSLYKWKNELFGEEETKSMSESDKSSLSDDKDTLLAELKLLKKQIYRQQMELDVLNKTAEIIKKDQGIDSRELMNKEKARLIDALRIKYPLNELLMTMTMSKSCYFYQREAMSRPDKYIYLRTDVKNVFIESQSCYGYRRVHSEIKSKGMIISEKVVRRIMSEEQLVVPYIKKRRYNAYKGETNSGVENLIARNFHADTPNAKWLTDLTEFRIPAGKVYLSLIIDCFDGLAVSWAIGTSPDAKLVNTMLDDAICSLADGERPILHSDRGSHYRWADWVARMINAELTRSMSNKGCPQDNAACEGFFGRLKNEMFYSQTWKDVSVDRFIDELDRYLRWYNEKRIKMSLGGLSPVAYRRRMGLVS